MNKLEKSIRKEMKYYGDNIRNGHYGVAGFTTGLVPDDYKVIQSVVCDVDFEKKTVTDIRIYGYGDAFLERDYYGESIDITAPVEEYLKKAWVSSWDSLIWDIRDIVQEEIRIFSSENILDNLRQELISDDGYTDTVAGEIVKAVSIIVDEYYNTDSCWRWMPHYIGFQVGRETCNPAARYLMGKASNKVKKTILDMWGGGDFGEDYERLLKLLICEVVEYIQENPQTKKIQNDKNILDFKDYTQDVDNFPDDYLTEDELITIDESVIFNDSYNIIDETHDYF